LLRGAAAQSVHSLQCPATGFKTMYKPTDAHLAWGPRPVFGFPLHLATISAKESA
jgi:hypothetical protein